MSNDSSDPSLSLVQDIFHHTPIQDPDNHYALESSSVPPWLPLQFLEPKTPMNPPSQDVGEDSSDSEFEVSHTSTLTMDREQSITSLMSGWTGKTFMVTSNCQQSPWSLCRWTVLSVRTSVLRGTQPKQQYEDYGSQAYWSFRCSGLWFCSKLW